MREVLAYRKQMLEYGYGSSHGADELWIMCSRDILFYVNTFCWTFDPRLLPNSTKIPFTTYPFQDEALLEIINSILTGQDVLIEKSRDMGATWLIILAYKWLWTFYPAQSFRLVSRNEDLVDKNEDPDCLFWKLMFIIDNEPNFIMRKGSYNKIHLHLFNKLNGSVIDGNSTTGDVARGGRCGSMGLDEFASVEQGYDVLKSTRDITNCRIFNSTPKGVANAFYEVRQFTEITVLRFHWTQDPRKNMGMYTTDANGKLNILDKGCAGEFRVGGYLYFYPDDYPFILDGKMRSPWYDHQCKRAAHPTEIAQELDIDYLGSDYQFFWPDDMLRIEKETLWTPFFTGEFEFEKVNQEFIELRECSNGRLNMWIEPDVYGKMAADDEFVIAVDVAVGTGASNSAISVSNKKTKEDVAEWVCPYTPPSALAYLAVSMGKYFNDATLIWDAGGPGRIFGRKVKELGYSNIYLRTDEKSLDRKVSNIPGYFFTKDNKTLTFGELRAAIHDEDYIIRSKRFVQEARQYVFEMANSSVVHSRSKSTVDPSGAKDNHGDIVVAKALAWKLIKLQGEMEKENKPAIPEFCFAGRREKYETKNQTESGW